MKFAIINPKERTVKLADWIDIHAADREAGLRFNETDHGICAPGIGVVVAEFSLYEPHYKQNYFAIGARLYAGNAVMYAFDVEDGRTVDLEAYPPPRWFSSTEAIEEAIQRGTVVRPVMSANGTVMWRWPDAVPKGPPRGF